MSLGDDELRQILWASQPNKTAADRIGINWSTKCTKLYARVAKTNTHNAQISIYCMKRWNEKKNTEAGAGAGLTVTLNIQCAHDFQSVHKTHEMPAEVKKKEKKIDQTFSPVWCDKWSMRPREAHHFFEFQIVSFSSDSSKWKFIIILYFFSFNSIDLNGWFAFVHS